MDAESSLEQLQVNQTRQAHPSCSIVVKLGHAVAPMVWSCDGAEDWGINAESNMLLEAFWTQHASHRYLATLRGIEFSSLTKKRITKPSFSRLQRVQVSIPREDALLTMGCSRSGSILGSCDPELMVLGIPSGKLT